MGHLRGLAQLPGPPAGVGLIVAPTRFSALCYSRPPSVVFPAPLGRRCYPSRPKVVLLSRRRSLFAIKGSDMTSELELAKPDGSRGQNRPASGVFWILLLNLGIYVADHILQIREIKILYLYHGLPAWFQFVTATFCHASWNHLSSNLFFLYIFGKLVEEEEGNFALWISYILTGAGANLVSWLLLPRSAVSLGASGAVFGLFAISVLVKMSWDWRKIIEVLILGQFVIDKVMEAAQASTNLTGTFGRGSFMAVNHIAHLSGALIGAALVLLVSRIPSQPYQKDIESVRHENKRP
ncbi:rhomboid-like protein 11, chloroplastic [Zingiber officinale]|uniref:rhomboid-like protein 11, chloroplastic n=2 Tax=Zingiber officinale TaxID=94328 RepID=UPI001C4BA105|nr:rhomboid-like protein 11, chloroplastic [Zingiber officinale]